MSKKLMFDTLSYAKLLAKGAIGNADIHAEALAHALSHNLYTRNEVDNMLETTSRRFDSELRAELQRFDERTAELRAELQRYDERTQQMVQQLKEEIRLEFKYYNERLQHNLYANIGVMSTLVVIMTAINALWHH